MSELARNEYIKEASDYLRGTLAEGLSEEITGAIVEDDQQLVKFHGMYLQDDRDLRGERTRKKLEKAFDRAGNPSKLREALCKNFALMAAAPKGYFVSPTVVLNKAPSVTRICSDGSKISNQSSPASYGSTIASSMRCFLALSR